MAYIDEHLDGFVARFAEEDNCTPEEWRHRAVRSSVLHRAQGEAASNRSTVVDVTGFNTNGHIEKEA
jgi:hypothetical protein